MYVKLIYFEIFQLLPITTENPSYYNYYDIFHWVKKTNLFVCYPENDVGLNRLHRVQI